MIYPLRQPVTFKRFLAPVVSVLLWLIGGQAFALGPHETLLLVNDESVNSILLANVYQRLRGIPDSNVVRLSIPARAYHEALTDISPENFTRYIWDPLQKAILDAQVGQQILACVFSCGFPTRITTEPAISITGAVFLRNVFPEEDLVTSGRYVSPLFSGPVSTDSALGVSASFDSARNRLLEAMPFPAMMLAFVGENGLTLNEAMDHLERTAMADHTDPSGTFYFVVNDDVRSTCRHWEFEPVAQAIRAFPHVNAVVSTNLPPVGGEPLCGFMTGSRTVPLDRVPLVPGAYADHLTSFGGSFDRREHMKATAWLNAGAAFSSGTVTEPYAIWAKFSHACIFLHSLSGCSAIESFYQSVRSPLQILPLGDALSKPWAPRLEPIITAPDSPLLGTVSFQGSVKNERRDVFYRFQWLVDGRVVSVGRTFVWNTRSVSDGSHTLRLVVRRQIESVRHQNYTECSVVVANGGEQ